MTRSLVSILIPAYNAERWIVQTIESALAQDWSPCEVIVVDDGSTDGTADAARRFTSAGVQVVTQRNQGQSAAQNRAIRESQGRFIQYLDADDLIGPDKISRQMARLERDPGCVASGEWARFYVNPSEAAFVPEPVWCDLSPVEWLVRAWSGRGPMMQAAIWLIPRAVIERAGPWNERLSLINDFEYFTRVLLASEGIRFCDGARLYYRSGNPGSLASLRSPAAWRSALLSLELGTGALLEREGSPATRRACADQFQLLAYDAHLEDAEVASAAQAHAIRLGGASVAMDGGPLFRVLRLALGWRGAKRVKRAAYRLGYAPASHAAKPAERRVTP